MDWPTYMEKQNKGQCQMFISGVSASCPDAIDFLDMFTVKNFAPGSNKFFYSNPEYEALFKKVEGMQNSPQRQELYRQLEHVLLEDYPAAFLNHRSSFYLTHHWYKNYKPFVFGYGSLKYHRVDVQDRRQYSELLKQLKKEGK
jgi:ABC-type oligopeptide transport system substrate-binding subunit